MITLIAFGVGYAMTLTVDLALIIAAGAFAADVLWRAVRRRMGRRERARL